MSRKHDKADDPPFCISPQERREIRQPRRTPFPRIPACAGTGAASYEQPLCPDCSVGGYGSRVRGDEGRADQNIIRRRRAWPARRRRARWRRQDIGRLRPADRDHAAEDEAGDALDSGILSGLCFGGDARDVVVSRKVVARSSRRGRSRPRPPPALRGWSGRRLREIELHQPLFHLRRVADRFRPKDEAMAIERVGLALDLVAIIGEPRRGGGLDDAAAGGI